MLKETRVTIDRNISQEDCNKVFVIKQLPATKMRNMMFAYQDIFKISNGEGGTNIAIDVEKKQNLYFDVLENIDFENEVNGKKTIIRLNRSNIDGYVSDMATLDYLVKEFWSFNVGDTSNLMEKSLNALTGIC